MKYQQPVTSESFAGALTGNITSNEHYPAAASSTHSKKSFLVYHHNKYLTIPVKSIAFFYVKFDATIIATFDKQEYSINYSLDHIQQLLPADEFFRVNRQYLINFSAIKETEHYFARKLLVVPSVVFSDKLIVSKEKARVFLDWLENH